MTWQEIAVSVAISIFVCTRSINYLIETFLERAYPGIGTMVAHGYEAIIVALLLVVIASRPRPWKALGTMGVLLYVAIAYLSYLLTNDYFPPLMLALFLVATAGMPLRPLMVTFTLATLVMFGTQVLVDSFGPVWSLWKLPNTRYICCYGFGHPNANGIEVFAIYLGMALCFDRKRWWIPLTLASLGGAAISFYSLECKTSAIALLLLAILLVLEAKSQAVVRLVESRRFFIGSLIGLVVLIMVVLYLLVGPLFGTPVSEFASKVMTGRLGLAHRAYEGLGNTVSLFGTTEVGYVNVDNSFWHYLTNNGVAVLAAMVILFARGVVYVANRKPQFIIWVVALLCLLYALMEFESTLLHNNGMLLLLGFGLLPGKATAPDATPDADLEA